MANSGVVVDGRNREWRGLAAPSQTDPPTQPEQSADLEDSGRSAGFVPMMFCALLIVVFLGRPFDQFATGYHIPGVICGVAILVMLFTKWGEAIRSRAAIATIVFILILLVSALFSVWRGGSFTYIQQYVQFNLVILLLLGSAPGSVKNVRWLIYITLVSCIVDIAWGAAFDEEHRLFIKNSSLGNSNDVALLGGFCLPLFLYVASRFGTFLKVVIGLAGIVACLAVTELAGTRAALVAFAVVALIYFVRANAVQKLGLVSCVGAIFVGSILFLPKSNLERLATITSAFSSEDEPADSQSIQGEARGSTEEHRQLTEDALLAFSTHPILGVGPGGFEVWRWDSLHKHGRPSHDTYVQVAAEEGLPGVLAYFGMIAAIAITLYRASKPAESWEEGRSIALALIPSLAFFAVFAFFMTCDRHPQSFVLAGFAIALERLRTEQVARTAAASKSAQQAAPELEPAPNPMRSTPKSKVALPTDAREPAATREERPVRYRFNRSTPVKRG